MPKYNDFDLDLQTGVATTKKENPVSNDCSGTCFHCSTSHCISRRPRCEG